MWVIGDSSVYFETGFSYKFSSFLFESFCRNSKILKTTNLLKLTESLGHGIVSGISFKYQKFFFHNLQWPPATNFYPIWSRKIAGGAFNEVSDVHWM